MLSRARSMRREPTLAEKQLWKLLRDRRLGLKFRRQVPMGDYIADFACFEAALVVEADGAAHRDPAYDAARDRWFAEQGFRVLRFSNDLVIGSPNMVTDAIRAASR